MRKSFYLLLVLLSVHLIGCRSDVEGVEPELPGIQKPDTVQEPDTSNALDCVNYDPYLYLFVIDKDSNNLLDATYSQTGHMMDNKIYVKDARLLDSRIYTDPVETLVSAYEGFLMINTKISFQHDRYFTATGDSLVFETSTFKVPMSEYYTQLKVDWSNNDTDTFDIRIVKACGIMVDSIYYKGSVIGIRHAILMKDLKQE